MLELLNIMKQYGWQGLVFGGVLWLVYKLIGENIKSISEHTKNKLFQKKEIKLKMHAFFNSINYSLNVEIPSMTVFKAKPTRQMLLKDLIHCTLASIEEVSESIAERDHGNWNHVEWNYEMRSFINEMNVLFIEKCESKGIPEIVYKKYLVWYFERLNHMRVVVDQIASTDTYPTPEIKTSTLFLAFNFFLVTMIADAEKTLKELNGDITGIVYRGHIIEPLGEHGSLE